MEFRTLHLEDKAAVNDVLLPLGRNDSALGFANLYSLTEKYGTQIALEDGVRHRIDRIFEDAGVHREMVIETQYAMTICALVMQGVGCSILNPVTAADYAERGLTVRDFAPEVHFEYMLFTPKLRMPEARPPMYFWTRALSAWSGRPA